MLPEGSEKKFTIEEVVAEALNKFERELYLKKNENCCIIIFKQTVVKSILTVAEPFYVFKHLDFFRLDDVLRDERPRSATSKVLRVLVT